MTVYIVYWRIPYEGSVVEGVFSSRKKAIDEVKRLQISDGTGRNQYEFEEMEVK